MTMLALALALAMASSTSSARAEDLPPVRAEEETSLDLAFADVSDPNPGSGRGQIVAGWIALGLGVAGVAQAPLCELNDFERRRERMRCRRMGLAVGVVGLVLATPWLIFGYQRRADQRAWKRRHGLDRVTLDVTGRELAISYRATLF